MGWISFDSIKDLQIGDLICSRLNRTVYIVTGNFGTRAIAVKTADVTNPGEWEIYRSDKPAESPDVITRAAITVHDKEYIRALESQVTAFTRYQNALYRANGRLIQNNLEPVKL